MRAVGTEYQSLIKSHLSPESPNVPFYSSVSSQTLERGSDFGAEYWQRNLESPVLFRQAVVRLLQTSSTTLHLEVGPHSALAGPLKQIYTEMAIIPPYLSVQKRGSNSAAAFLAAIGELHCRGVPVKFPISDGARPLRDLPPYPWHLSKTFWPDSRVTQSWQFSEHPPHELLGSRTLGSSSTAPSWRCLLSLDKVPWILDHCVGSDVVFPAAAYIAMAGESIRQLSGESSYTVRDLRIANALVLSQESKVELFTSMRKEELTHEETSEWWDLTIQSCTPSGIWTTHCRCRARGGQVSKGPDIIRLDAESFLRSVEPARWYKAMSRVGYRYGPEFRGMRKIRASVKSTAVSVEVSDKRGTLEHQDRYALHPATIDQMLQSLIVANHSGEPRLLDGLYLPTRIDELFIISKASKKNILLQSITSGGKGDYLGDCSGTIFDRPAEEPVVFMKGLRLSPIELEDAVAGATGSSKVAVMAWEQDIDMTADVVSPASDSSFPEIHQQLEELFVLCGAAALKEVDAADIPITEVQTHLTKHYTWLRSQISKCSPQLLHEDAGEVHAKIKGIVLRLKKTPASAVATLIERCYTHAQELFNGTGSPLEVFLKDNALHKLYDWMNTLFTYKPLLQLLSHKRGRHLKILEIGAGTGGLTSRILKDLTGCFEDGKVLGTYVLTDVSAGFFPAAKERFHDIAPGLLDYRVLDISRDPAAQGFGREDYDLIVASNVLHATPKLDETLQHVRSLLKPDGRLLMHELCCNTKWINFIMGHLSGWWLGNSDSRPDEPYISPRQWEERLSLAGFSTPEVVYDAKPQHKLNATIISRPAAPKESDFNSGQMTLLCEEESHPVVAEIDQALWGLGHPITISTPHAGCKNLQAGSIVVSVIDLCRDDGYFHDMTEIKLDILKRLLKTLQDNNSILLWLTRPCQLGSVDPTFAPVLGIARTARVEMGVQFATMELDSITADSLQAVSQVSRRLISQHAALASNMGEDVEFSYTSGRILIPRCKWTPISRALSSKPSVSSSKMLQISRPGALQTLHWVSRQLPDEIPSDHVKIDVRAAGLNFKDVVTAMGLIKPSAMKGLGCEASGIVTSAGTSVMDVRVGDRVMIFAPEAACFSTEILVPAQLCVRIPSTLAFSEAAGMPCIFITVLRALVEKAGLSAGQTVLIHSAAGGVGIAAIQVARWIGARVYATVGSDEKIDFLIREWNIPKEHIFSSRDISFVEGVKAATGGLGVDVVLNSLSGELLHASWDCVAPHGTFIELGKKDTLAGGKLAMAAFDGNRSFIGVEMANLAVENPAIIHRLLQQCVDLYQQNHIQSVRPAKVFACREAEDAFRHLYQGTHTGKVVLDMTENDDAAFEVSRVPMIPKFREQATYVLVGGMGGLGGTIARWMASHGAKSLLFISRSAGRSNDDQALLSELRYAGCEADAVPCDIADEPATQIVISRLGSSKRIAGVLHLAMVLADGALSDLTLSQWQTATSPKIRGTWNLHRALPHDIDFFVLFGSTSGVHGYPGQANYAAANTFLDAFAQYRRGLGQPCSVVDLGGVEDVGYVSRTQEVEDVMTKSGSKLVSEADMLRGVQLAIAESRPVVTGAETETVRSTVSGQVVLGLDCSTSINDSGNRVVWKHDSRMNLYPDIAENERASRKEAGSSGLAEFLSSLQSRPEEIETTASTAYLAREIARRVSGFLMREVDAGGIDTTLSPSALGVDSLMTIEIRNWWKHTLGVDISVFQLTSAQSFDQLGQLAGRQLKDRMMALSKK